MWHVAMEDMPDMASLSSMGEKFRLIREAEGMTRQEFADCVGLPYGTVTNYEVRGKQVTEGALLKVTKHPKFKKYAYWLSTDETMPEVGQISPALSLDGSCNSAGDRVSTETIQKLSR
jgi:DNA-binding XRE family transcriptional regulator